MADTQELIKKQWERLPDEVRDAIRSTPWEQTIIELGQKYRLNVDQLGEFQMETMLTLIGLVHPDQYSSELRSRIHVSEEVIQSLVMEANQRIFGKIRESLKHVYESAGEMDENEISGDEEEILEHSGVEIEQGVSSTASSDPSTTRNEMLSSIENPPQTTSTNLSELKLRIPHTLKPSTTDYSLGNINSSVPVPPKPPKSSGDPYREQF